MLNGEMKARWLTAALAAIIGSWPAPVGAACTVSDGAAIACFDPESAARAWQIVGRDTRVLDKDYVRALLSQAGCSNFSRLADPGEPIALATQGRVPSLEGWTTVLFLTVRNKANGGSAVWIAQGYVNGTCDPMKRVQ